jgi:predicted amidophosphoribosyltransferase
MIRFYCPNCWSDFTVDLKICPVCGANIENMSAERNLEDKLINALGHPDHSTVVRAIWLLGQLSERKQ